MSEQTIPKVESNVPRMAALTDDMIARLSSNTETTAAVLNDIQASGLAGAIPTLGKMAKSGDVERLAQLARAYAAAEDAVTEEMVSRLSDAVGGGLALIDQVQRAGLDRAIPALVALVDNGDLQRLVHLARVYSSAEDAVTEEMVGRLAETIGGGLSLLDRMNRGGGERVVAMLERLENSGALEKAVAMIPLLLDRLEMLHRLLGCIEDAASESARAAKSGGGVGGLWASVKDGESQDTLRFLLQLGKKLRTTCQSAR
jgi:hypothetical protein